MEMLERGREAGTEGDIKKVMEVVRGGRVSHCLLAASQRGGGERELSPGMKVTGGQ